MKKQATSFLGINQNKKPLIKCPVGASTTASSICKLCSSPFGLLTQKRVCSACHNLFCGTCCWRYLLLPASSATTTSATTTSSSAAAPMQPHTATLVCESCYKQHNAIDFSKHFDEFGQDHTVTMVMLHGALSGRGIFNLYQVPAWSPYFHILNTDLPAHGSRLGEPLTLKTAVDCVAELIRNHAHNSKAIVFGYSMGGYVALGFAKRYPELCHGLIVGGASSDMSGTAASFMLGSISAVYSILPESLLWKLIPMSFSHIPADILDNGILRCGVDYKLWPQFTNFMHELLAEGYVNLLRGISCPVLFVNGSKDTQTHGPEFSKAAPHGQLVVIPNATHLLCLEPCNRELLHSALITFCVEQGWIPPTHSTTTASTTKSTELAKETNSS
ncbi:alpha/beta fold hydrolase [Pelomyxa schiedti]|nr:alpha/beta fold hydrolase [Pelomyxa schiedti]